MPWASRAIPPVLLVATLGLGACGGSAAVSGDDPVAVAKGYVQAVAANPTGGVEFLATESTEKLKGSTSISRFLGAHKGASWEVATVNFPDPGETAPKPTQKACVIGQPAPGQICIVTFIVKSGAETAYFHVNLENRYTGKWEIIDVDQVAGKPDNLLPSGNEAHKG